MAPLQPLAKIKPNASVRVLAPASFAEAPRVERGMERLRLLGYTPSPGKHASLRGPLYFAGTAKERLDDLLAAFADPGVDMIAAVRGGYGSNYILDGLDLDLIARHPKPLFAYSDLTGVQLRLLDKIGLPVFHGPMVAADFALENGVHLESWHAALQGEPYACGAEAGLRTLRTGEAHGTLYGGCLSILCAMIGTAWEPATEGKLLFLEDVGVKPYQVDRMLWQLRAAGKFEGVRGIIFGEMLNCLSPGAPASLLEDAILNALAGIDVPIAMGLRSGHVSHQNVTLVFGSEAELHATEAPELRLLKPVVKP